MSPEFGTDPAFLAAYGAVIRNHRGEQGLDRKELAERAGASYSYLSAIESGHKMPSGETLFQWHQKKMNLELNFPWVLK